MIITTVSTIPANYIPDTKPDTFICSIHPLKKPFEMNRMVPILQAGKLVHREVNAMPNQVVDTEKMQQKT